MSILQEYEQIRKEMGEDQWSLIETYLTEVRPDLRLDEVLYIPEVYTDFKAWASGELTEADILGELFEAYTNIAIEEAYLREADRPLDEMDLATIEGMNKRRDCIKKQLKDQFGIDIYRVEERRDI